MAKNSNKEESKKKLNLFKRLLNKFKFMRTWKFRAIVFLFFLFTIIVLSAGYYLGEKRVAYEIVNDLVNIQRDTQSNIKKEIKSKPKKLIKKDSTKDVVKHHQEKKKVVTKAKTSTPKRVIKKLKSLKPKLVIIIDDVYKPSHIRAIKKIGFKITPSIFPPFKLNMHTNHLADNLEHFMIHLPMESGSRQFNTQYKTLFRDFSRDKMEQRVKELRKLFPKAHYINNHTGSVFTRDYRAMYRLYEILRKEGFVFVDSRTTGASKVKRVVAKFGDTYIARDVFIDNTQSVSYIHKQLKKAVRVAKKRGYAIAIGHPHDATLKALSSAKYILKDVNVVYIDELYKGL